MEAVLNWSFSICNQVYWGLLGRWLWNLYRFGPSITASGFWAGLADPDLCAKLSPGSQVSDWLTADRGGITTACAALINRSFHSFEVSVHTLLYVTTAYMLVKAVAAHIHRRHMSSLFVQDLKTHGIMVPFSKTI
jgi:hypothetical protein